MTYDIKRTDREINDVLNWAAAAEEEGTSSAPSMTFEEGVSYALRWVVGLSDENPMDD